MSYHHHHHHHHHHHNHYYRTNMIKKIIFGVVIVALIAVLGTMIYLDETKDYHVQRQTVAEKDSITERPAETYHTIGTEEPESEKPDKADVKQVNVAALMYHQFFTGEDISAGALNDNGTIYVSEFESDLQYFQQHQISVITVDQLISFMDGEIDLPDQCVMITIDDCNYSLYRYVYPLLKKYGYKANAAIIGHWSDAAEGKDRSSYKNYYCTWDEIKEMSDSGLIVFGSHSYYMHSRDKGRYGTQINENETFEEYQKALSQDMILLNEKIKHCCGYEPVFMAYPYSRVCQESIEILTQDCGYKLLFAGDGEKVRSTKSNCFLAGGGYKDSSYLIRRFARHKGDDIANLLNDIWASYKHLNND